MRPHRYLLAILPLMAACASNEPVRDPQTTLPSAYTAPSSPQAAAAPLDQWWLAFADAQLTSLIEEGLAASPDARIATARIEEARATRSANRYSAWPQGALVANASTTDSEQVAGTVNPFSVEGRTESYTVGLDVSWEIDLFGRVRAGDRAVESDFAATVFNVEGSRASLAAGIADSLFLARGLAQQVASAQESARISRGLRDAARVLAERGISATSDTQRLDADVAQNDAALVAAEADLAAAKRSLLVLLGRGAEPVENLVISPVPSEVPPVPAAVPGDLLRRRPDVREAEQRMVLATNLLTVDRLALFPKLTLLPGVGLRRNDGPGVDFTAGGPVTTQQSTTFANWTLGVGLSVPVLDRPKLLAQARASGFRAEQAVLAYEKSVQTAFGEADNALTGLAADRRRIALLSAGEAQAKDAYEAARRRYDLGLDNLTTLLSAEQAWRGARTAAISARTQGLRRAVQTFKALGGGWSGRRAFVMSQPMNLASSRLKAASAALLTLAVLSGCGDKKDADAPKAAAKPAANARAVQVATVERRALEGGVTASGVLVSREEAVVTAEVAGYRVARVMAEMGDYVRAGQPLVQLDDALIRSQVQQAAAQAAQAEVAARQAFSQAERVKGLDGTGVLSQEAIEQRRYAAESARAQADSQAAALRDLQTRASKMTVRAPVSGRVLERTVRPGDLSGNGQPMFRIARDGLVELEAQVAEASLSSIRVGAPASVATPDGSTVQGVVRLIGPSVAADSRLGQVRIALPAGSGLRPGGFGQARFGDVSADTPAVPEAALRYDADGVSVMVVDQNNRVHQTPVKTGRRGGGYAELISGPPVGTRVLLGAASFVLEGDVVKPVAAQAAAQPATARPAAQ